MLKKLYISSLVFVFLLISANQIYACTCAGPRSSKPFQTCRIFWDYDVVFIGNVTKISYDETEYQGKMIKSKMLAHVAVNKAIRGVEKGETIVIETSPSTGSCGFPFEEGEDYLVYQKRGKDGKFREYLCGATINLKYANADLEYIKSIEDGETGNRVYGSVSRLVRESFAKSPQNTPLSNIEITLKSKRAKKKSPYLTENERKNLPKYKKRQFTTYTDTIGYYLFNEIPAGLYIIEAKLPTDLTELKPRNSYTKERYIYIKEDSKRCANSNFGVTSLANISGKVVDKNGQIPPQQYISLVPIDEKSKTYFYTQNFSQYANKSSGEFLFKNVPAGKYILAINPEGCPNSQYKGFGKMFYPGVGNQKDAEIITMSEYKDLTLGNFKLLPTLKERLFSGVVLRADKKPFSKAKIILFTDDKERCRNYGKVAETRTDEFGRFTIKGLEGYKYKIRAFNPKRRAKIRLSEFIEIGSTGNIENLELVILKQ